MHVSLNSRLGSNKEEKEKSLVVGWRQNNTLYGFPTNPTHHRKKVTVRVLTCQFWALVVLVANRSEKRSNST